MHFLISNDDGIHAPGLQALAERLAQVGRVTVVAPDRERSASGHAITVYYPLRVRQYALAENITAYAVDGTPADCVRLGCEALLDEPCDMVVSGINYGVNLGTDVIYSGTVSAAMEGAVMGYRALAVSLAVNEGEETVHWDTAAEYAARLAMEALDEVLPPNVVVNVNVPNLPATDVKGYEITRLSLRRYLDGVHKRIDPRGGVYYWRAGTAVDAEGQEGTDTLAVADGYVSVTPVHLDLTHYDSLAELEKWKLSDR